LAAIFVPILNVWAVIVLLILISIYDIYAVWKSKFMVGLAKYQIQNLKIFTGFFVPYLTKDQTLKLRKMKGKTKNSKIKVSLAILGGGDVAFPLIFAGVMLRSAGLIPALIIVLFSTLALWGLFIYSQKGKFYPAMPFITAGCLVGWLVTLLI
jgi:presenilin-like A22 family membrane protease